ncbi:uncharacterized protein LOC118597872 isoform X1 [Oryzias melastigma]|uniref:uncharacterized protein LOC118597872 isoform X1 n=1 Tax=Oryzias melastigma TaxID=30732 RepID=UPI00168CCE7A|nr:uncharacterized protein LOC118597872 isoform X1 [Oryzias melastigma]
MSEKFSRILRERQAGNDIPSGRQLPRTPPMRDVKRILDFADPEVDFETPQQNEESNTRSAHAQNGSGPGLDPDSQTANSHSMLKGMKGYQLTQSDLDFLRRMEEEKLIRKLQGDLKELQKMLRDERKELEQAHVSVETEQAEINKFPSRDQLSEWIRLVLQMTSPTSEFADTDVKSLLAMVTVKDVHKVVTLKKRGLAQMRKSLSKKRKKEAEERGKLEKEIASQEFVFSQMKIQGLMRELSELKSELSQREASFEPPDQPNVPIMPQENPKTKPKRRARPKQEGSHGAEESEVKGNGAKRPPNRKNRNEASDKPPSVPEKTKKKTKNAEEQNGDSNEAGRGKPGEAATSRARNRGKNKAGKAAGEEGQNVVLRRSKRIINQR